MAKRTRVDANKRAEREYDSKRAGRRSRNWTVIFYPDDLPEGWPSSMDENHVRWIEGPLHDKDLNADGSPKKPHVHALLLAENVKTKEQIVDLLKGIFGESESGSIVGAAIPQIVSDRCAVVRYMAHLDNPEKVQYDVNDIKGHNGADPAEILRYSVTETREMIIAMEEYIEQNGIIELSDFSAAIRYEHPEWHTLLATKMTVYFNAFIRSRRHKTVGYQVDSSTGEIM